MAKAKKTTVTETEIKTEKSKAEKPAKVMVKALRNFISVKYGDRTVKEVFEIEKSKAEKLIRLGLVEEC